MSQTRMLRFSHCTDDRQTEAEADNDSSATLSDGRSVD